MLEVASAVFPEYLPNEIISYSCSLSCSNFHVEWLVALSTWKWIIHVTHIISLSRLSTRLLHVARWVQQSIVMELRRGNFSQLLLNSKYINGWVCKLSQLTILLIQSLSWTLFFSLVGVEPFFYKLCHNQQFFIFFCHHKYLRSSNRKVSL